MGMIRLDRNILASAGGVTIVRWMRRTPATESNVKFRIIKEIFITLENSMFRLLLLDFSAFDFMHLINAVFKGIKESAETRRFNPILSDITAKTIKHTNLDARG